MHVIEKNKRHCDSCNKVIVDFSKMTDNALVEYFNKHGISCGKFAAHQLNRPLNADVSPPKFSVRPFLMLSSLLLAVPAAGQRNEQPKVIIHETESTKLPDQSGITVERKICVSGMIRTDSLKPVCTIVEVSNGRDTVSVFSGSDGKYELTITCLTSDSLTVSAWENWSDHFRKTFNCEAEKDTIYCDILLVYDPEWQKTYCESLKRVLIVGAISCVVSPRKPSFFYWLFHPIKYLRAKRNGWFLKKTPIPE